MVQQTTFNHKGNKIMETKWRTDNLGMKIKAGDLVYYYDEMEAIIKAEEPDITGELCYVDEIIDLISVSTTEDTYDTEYHLISISNCKNIMVPNDGNTIIELASK